MKNISILGITGSIGESSLNICNNFKDEINLIAVSAHKNVKLLLEIIDKYSPQYAVVSDTEEMRKHFGKYEVAYKGIKIYSGDDGLSKICSDKNNDIIVNAICGKAGLTPSLTILESGIDIALANKESVVCAGPILSEVSAKTMAKIIPVDSEHSAVFHLLKDKNKESIRNIYLTASGGPFLNLDKKEWNTITINDALNHPTWKMGSKITIDSATMANKGLEVIECHYLFDFDYSKINVLIHPQSLIHSMVETLDSEIYAQLGPNDMSIPLQNAVFYPDIKKNVYNTFDFSKAVSLELLPVDMSKFKMLRLAFECGRKDGLYTAFYNFVNELLVYHFLSNNISFLQIEEFMEKALDLFDKKNDVDKYKINIDNIKETEIISDLIINELLKDL